MGFFFLQKIIYKRIILKGNEQAFNFVEKMFVFSFPHINVFVSFMTKPVAID